MQGEESAHYGEGELVTEEKYRGKRTPIMERGERGQSQGANPVI